MTDFVINEASVGQTLDSGPGAITALSLTRAPATTRGQLRLLDASGHALYASDTLGIPTTQYNWDGKPLSILGPSPIVYSSLSVASVPSGSVWSLSTQP
jgi:hypothetical protein